MNDFIAGPRSGPRDGRTRSGGGSAPPVVLLAALSTALLIAVAITAFFIGSSDGGGADASGGAGADDPVEVATTPAAEERVLLRLQVEGGGIGKVRIEPLGVACMETCEHQFATGTRVSLSFDAADGSRFEGWNDACTGSSRCEVFMDRERTVTATFEGTATTQCEDGRDNEGDGFVDERDPGCRADTTEAPDDRPEPVSDCRDGRDNDSDGLVDTAQDPGCDTGETEEDDLGPDDPGATPTTPPPPPVNECGDGRDNDSDGLVDRAQDPGCASGGTEGSTGATTTPGVSECRDGRDNDADGLTDRPADPGCDADGSEAGDR